MKIYKFLILGISSFSLFVHASASQSVPMLADYTVVERGPHHKVILCQTVQTNVIHGRLTIQTNSHSYVQIETGMHSLSSDGAWIDASDEIMITPEGAIATNTAHKVFFAANANSESALRVLLPNRRTTLSSHVLCLSYFDRVTGSNAIIAQLHDSTGELIAPNRVLYTGALSGDCTADILYENSKSGIEQNIILRTRPPPPHEYGISNAILQVWTEFINPASPSRYSLDDSSSDIPDEQLDFGAMQIGPGEAFFLGNERLAVRVFRQWIQSQGRTFLVEQVPIKSIALQLQLLPALASADGTIRPRDTARFALPTLRYANRATDSIKMAAKNAVPRTGFLLDYNMTSATNFLFQADTTYYVSGSIFLAGSNVFEGGCVIKYATNAAINVYPTVGTPTVTFLGAAYRPIVFTAKDDQSVGTAISGSASSPSGYYANPALYFAALTQAPALAHIRIAYAKQAISLQGISADISDAQFVNCSNVLVVTSMNASHLRNALIANCITNFAFGSGVLTAENVTFSKCSSLAKAPSEANGSAFALTNCILADITNLATGLLSPTAGTNGLWNSPVIGYIVTNNFYPFQTVGGANYYLADGCAFRRAGTTNINSNLLASLRQKTTQPPTIVFNQVLTTTNLTLTSNVQRESGPPDLGYAYDPIDYEFGAVTVTNSAVITTTAGTVIAGFGTNGNGKSFTLANGAQFLAQGAPTRPVRIVEYSAVQEQAPSNWCMPFYSIITDDIYEDGAPPQAYFNSRFTDFSSLADDAPLLGLLTSSLDIRDCQLHGGYFIGYGQTCATNCLFERVQGYVMPVISDKSAVLKNNLFYGGFLEFQTVNNNSGTLSDNLFDKTSVSFDDGTYSGGYNAYVNNRIWPTNSSDIVLPATDYVSGPLGPFYYPTNGGKLSLLINSGSTIATNVGLYHFTVVTNFANGLELKETNSVVDIGFHYVAVNNTWNAIDTDGDGVPDCIEDSNGNGNGADDPTSWLTYNSLNGLTSSNKLQVFTPLR